MLKYYIFISKDIKYIGMNLTKGVQALYIDNYKHH